MLSTAAIAWHPWRAESFARARAENKPVLLWMAPAWCRHSAEMDGTTFGDADVASLVNTQFTPDNILVGDPHQRKLQTLPGTTHFPDSELATWNPGSVKTD